MIEIQGLVGFSSWPMVDSVEHNEPTEDVVITISNTEDVITAMLVNGESTQMYSATGGIITIPAEDFTDAITNHAKLTVLRGLNNYGGSITFLPEQESEPFPITGALNLDGTIDDTVTTLRCTELVDVSLVTEMVYSGRCNKNRGCVVGYDENGDFAKLLLRGTGEYQSNVHIVYDGTYKFVRACYSIAATAGSLFVYFRNRGVQR